MLVLIKITNYLRVNVLTIALFVFCIIFNKADMLCVTYSVMILHELAHCRAAVTICRLQRLDIPGFFEGVSGVGISYYIPPRSALLFRNIQHFGPCWPETQKGGISWRQYKDM